MWPNVGIKSSPIWIKSYPKSSHSSTYYLESGIYHNSPKSCQIFRLFCKKMYIQVLFKKHNLVTLFTCLHWQAFDFCSWCQFVSLQNANLETGFKLAPTTYLDAHSYYNLGTPTYVRIKQYVGRYRNINKTYPLSFWWDMVGSRMDFMILYNKIGMLFKSLFTISCIKTVLKRRKEVGNGTILKT